MPRNIFDNKILTSLSIPMCIVDQNGKVLKANEHIGDVFLYDGLEGSDFFVLTGIKLNLTGESNSKHVIERNGKTFQLLIMESPESNDEYVIIFKDISDYENIRRQYEAEKICVCKINIDNYDELTATTVPEIRISITAELDKQIRHWAAKYNGAITRFNASQYIMYFQYSYLSKLIESKFDVLDQIRTIETTADFPMSLSIGIGVGEKDVVACTESASAALDLALGRGGDQAVIKKGTNIQYYGGKSQTVEKSNKGKSRVVAHALKRLITQSRKVVIMGHQNPDMDCFGAALGIYRMCLMFEKEAYILLDKVNESLNDIYRQAKDKEIYNFIDCKKAEAITDKETLLILVDTHRISYVENKNLLDLTEKIVVIDHHRRAEDSVKNPTLSYIESYASSASELVSEILQYTAPKKTLVKLEAEALLAGISIDTNRFAVKTGVRTFEAAAWLRRSGADTTEVKRFFRVDKDVFNAKAKAIAAASYHSNGVVTAICQDINSDVQIINSQVADELLNVKGVRVCFVAGKLDEEKTAISARSLGDVNVQVIMEKLGGGGHLTTAGAQVKMSPEEAIEKVLENIDL
ncbi:MAG: DHH family phosphoesterase [Eubacteriaceae bacterium]|nr:DHH family phosphoesterase [Eubacteriaceae bacterium]